LFIAELPRVSPVTTGRQRGSAANNARLAGTLCCVRNFATGRKHRRRRYGQVSQEVFKQKTSEEGRQKEPSRVAIEGEDNEKSRDSEEIRRPETREVEAQDREDFGTPVGAAKVAGGACA
jgi:hypothetical protein